MLTRGRLRGATLLVAALAVLVLSPDAHDSGIVKLPVFALGGFLVAALLCLRPPGRTPPAVTFTPLTAAVVVLALLGVAGWLRAPQAPGATDGLLLLLASGAVFAAGRVLWQVPGDVDQYALALAWISVPLIIVGLVQYASPHLLPVEFYLGEARRVGSLAGSPAFLAGLTLCAIPFAAAAAGTQPGGLRRAGFLILTGGLLLLLWLTGSRSGLAGAGAAAVVYLVLSRPRLPRRALPALFAVLLLLAAGMLVLFPETAARIAGTLAPGPASTLERRLPFWEAGVQAVGAAPLTGYGPGSFERVAGTFRSPGYWISRSEDIVPHAHNEALETAVEYGLPGLLAAFAVFGMALARARKASRSADHRLRRWGVAAAAALAGVLVDNLANVSLRQPPTAVPVWLLLGIVASPAFGPTAGRRIPLPPTAVGILRPLPLLAWCAFAVWYVPRVAGDVRGSAELMHGLLRWNAGDRNGAVTAYRTAIGHAPRLWLARTNLAAAYAQSGMPREALAEARTLAALYPGYPRSWLIQGIGLWQTGDPAGALRALERECALRDHPEAYYIESLVHRSGGNGRAEALALENVLRRSLASGVTQHLAYAALRLPEAVGGSDRTAERLRLYEELARAFPGDSSVSRGYALFRGH